MTPSQRLTRLAAIIADPQLSAVQKCIYFGLTLAADKTGCVRASTAQLQVWASTTRKATVVTATERMFSDVDCILRTSGARQVGTFQIVKERIEACLREAGTVSGTEVGTPTVPVLVRSQHQSGTLSVPVGLSGTPAVPAQPAVAKEKIPHTPLKENNNTTTSVATRPREAAVALSIDAKQLCDRLLAVCNGALDNPVNCQGLLNVAIPIMWIERGCDLDRDILPTLAAAGQRYHGKRIKNWSYFTGMVADAKAAREKGLPAPNLTTGGQRRPVDNTQADEAFFAAMERGRLDDEEWR